MAVQVANGSIVAIENGSSAAVVISAITNATQGVVTTAAAHGLAAGDIAEVTSGWSRLTNKIIRVGSAPTATTFVMEGIDTSNTAIYPAGGGAGTVAKVTGFTQLPQILNSSSSGGEQQFLEFQFLESDAQQRIPTFKNAAGITFSVADDPTLPGQQLARVANDDRLPRAIRVTLANGGILLYNAYVSIGTIPTLSVNELLAVEVSLSLLGTPTRY